METDTYMLPSYWASYLIDGDASGIDDSEKRGIDEWCAVNHVGRCLGVGEAEFTSWGDDGALGADRALFTFEIPA